MFKSRTARTITFDTMGSVERSSARDGLTSREGAVMDLLEDPVEFAQNMHRTLYSSSDLQELLSPDAPKRVDEIKSGMWEALGTAMERKNFDVAKEIHFTLESTINAAQGEAEEYGIAKGAIMEQLRQGLLELARLRFEDGTYTIDRMASDLEDAEGLLSGKLKPDSHISGESKERQDAA